MCSRLLVVGLQAEGLARGAARRHLGQGPLERGLGVPLAVAEPQPDEEAHRAERADEAAQGHLTRGLGYRLAAEWAWERAAFGDG